MNVYVNEKKISIFYGATVKSVLLKYFRTIEKKANLSDLDVRDAYDNQIALDGALSNNSKIYVK